MGVTSVIRAFEHRRLIIMPGNNPQGLPSPRKNPLRMMIGTRRPV